MHETRPEEKVLIRRERERLFRERSGFLVRERERKFGEGGKSFFTPASGEGGKERGEAAAGGGWGGGIVWVFNKLGTFFFSSRKISVP